MIQPLELIDKQDNFELIADEIAAIIKTEAAAQVALAASAGKPDPTLWDLRVYQDRSNRWEMFPPDVDTETPVVNVWFDSTDYVANKSDPTGRQWSSTTYNIDLYGYGVSSDNPAGGQLVGDAQAAQAVKRAIKLVRNILMSYKYTYLEQKGLVGSRWIESITYFQPQQDAENTAHVAGARIAFSVQFNEYSPQYAPEVLDLISARLKRADDNEIVIETDYDFTT